MTPETLGSGVMCLSSLEETLAFEHDASIEQGRPDHIVFPETAEQVAQILALAAQDGVAVTPRGAGTGLSGGAVAAEGGMQLMLTRLNRILHIDPDERTAKVQPGVVNVELSQTAAPLGLAYAPDPSSQRVSTIGGNVAENAGGPHCLAYGATTAHVIELDVTLHGGERCLLGSLTPDHPGYDLPGIVTGSEGTLAVLSEATVRLVPIAEVVRTFLAIFESEDVAAEAISGIIAGAGIIPVAIEMLDGFAVRALEESMHMGYPAAAGAVLLVELEGLREEVDWQAAEVRRVCEDIGAQRLEEAADEAARIKLWYGRKNLLGAFGTIAPHFYTHDMVVPRSKLPAVCRRVDDIARRYGFHIPNVAHAGDGNVHPTIIFDAREPDVIPRVLAAGREVLQVGLDAGGALSGEHGIGTEKREFMPLFFSPADLAAMRKVKTAFDPAGLLNPGKIFPAG